MPYVPPTASIFKTRYPEFVAVSDDLITLVIGEAIDQVGDTWLERDRARAQMLLAAHNLTLEGEPARSVNGASGAAAGTGMVKRDKVGDTETEFATPAASYSGTAASGYGMTLYGQQYLELMRKNFPAVVAV